MSMRTCTPTSRAVTRRIHAADRVAPCHCCSRHPRRSRIWEQRAERTERDGDARTVHHCGQSGQSQRDVLRRNGGECRHPAHGDAHRSPGGTAQTRSHGRRSGFGVVAQLETPGWGSTSTSKQVTNMSAPAVLPGARELPLAGRQGTRHQAHRAAPSRVRPAGAGDGSSSPTRRRPPPRPLECCNEGLDSS